MGERETVLSDAPAPADSYLTASLHRLGPAVRRDDVIEIAVNPDGSIWAEFQGDHAMSSLGVALTPVQVRDFAHQIASAARTQVSDKRPIISVSILYGTRPIRAQVVMAPAVEKAVATPGPSLVEVDMTAIGAFPPYAPYNRLGIYAERAAE